MEIVTAEESSSIAAQSEASVALVLRPWNEQWQPELWKLERDVRKGDEDGLRARWEFGNCLLKLRDGKRQLHRGVAAALLKDLGISRSELTARMKFAEKYREDQLANVISEYRTWFNIKQEGLTKGERAVASTTKNKSKTQKILDLLENLDRGHLTASDFKTLAKIAALAKQIAAQKGSN